MNLGEFASVAETNKPFDDAVVSVLKAIESNGWALFQVYDIKERLSAKGFSILPLKIIEICSAKYANKLISKNKLVSMCMPCRITVIQEPEQVVIAAMKPTMLHSFFPEITKEEAQEIENEIIEIINKAK